MRHSDEIAAYAQSCRQAYLDDLSELIAIPSVSEELFQASDQAPFGLHCVEALEKMMELCGRYGLPTRTIGNVIGIAEYGEGPRELDIVAHLDVQPAGPGWTTPPFALTIDGDTAYGRGASDDKGPALAALYAVRALKDLGIPLRKKVRLVFGTGEEYGISDIHYYTDKEAPPPFMFTPDHTFPVVNGSKASYTARLSAAFEPMGGDGAAVLHVKGGDNRGAVPGICTAQVRGAPRPLMEQAVKDARMRTGLPITLEENDGMYTLVSRGVSTHAVKADQGKSALTAMLELLCHLPFGNTRGHCLLRRFAEMFPHGDVAGRESGLFMEDTLSGGSLYNVGIFRYQPDGLEAQLRVTLPVTAKEEQFVPLFLERASRAGLRVDQGHFSSGRYVPLDDPYLKKLLASYTCHTGQEAYGIIAGGGSYASYFPRGVAFGCEPDGVDTRMHGAQEFVSIENMLRSIAIFAQAILEICG